MNGLVFDVGGTWTRIGRTDGRRLFHSVIVATPRTWPAAKKMFVVEAAKLFVGRKVQQVVGGLPGVLDAKHTKLLTSPHCPHWIRQPIKKDLTFLFRSPVTLENDSALGALGEARFGAGRGKTVMAYIAVGTGVGGARVIHGQLDRAAAGFEPGHQLVRNRRFEQIVGGQGRRRYRVTWSAWAQAMAEGLTNVTLLWSPEVIVLAGGVLTNPKVPWAAVKRGLATHLDGYYPHPPRLLQAQKGPLAGLYGAMALISRR